MSGAVVSAPRSVQEAVLLCNVKTDRAVASCGLDRINEQEDISTRVVYCFDRRVGFGSLRREMRPWGPNASIVGRDTVTQGILNSNISSINIVFHLVCQ